MMHSVGTEPRIYGLKNYPPAQKNIKIDEHGLQIDFIRIVVHKLHRIVHVIVTSGNVYYQWYYLQSGEFFK